MTNKDRLYQCFSISLGVSIDLITDDLKYQSIKGWDSISHMILISYIEEEFGISLDTDDVIDMSSVGKAKEILLKYNVIF